MKNLFCCGKLTVGLLLIAACTNLLMAQVQDVNDDTSYEVRVDFSKDIGPALHRASGILHSMGTVEPPDSLVLPLKLKAFRGRGNMQFLFRPGFYERLKSIGVEHIQLVLTDVWRTKNELYGYPGDNNDWQPWEKYVREVVTDCMTRNMLDIEYDIWNEPCDKTHFWKPARSQYYEAWRRAYKTIRSIKSDAVIVGPSCHFRDMSFLKEFLLYAKANDCLPDVLSWHEIGLPSKDGTVIPRHVNQMKAFLDSHKININRISLNEIVSPGYQFSPGAAVSYFAGIERTQLVESACRSCWKDVSLSGSTDYANIWKEPREPNEPKINSGENQSLDGLITYYSRKPRSTWWAYKSYADITGRLVDVIITDPCALIDGVAGYDINTKTAAVLIGRFGGDGKARVAITINNLKNIKDVINAGCVRVKVQHIPYTGTEELKAPVIIFNKEVVVRDNSISVILPELGPHDACVIRLGNYEK